MNKQATPEDYYHAFNSPSGRHVLDDLRRAYGGSSYVKGSPTETIYREGKRAVLLMIDNMIESHKIKSNEEDE